MYICWNNKYSVSSLKRKNSDHITIKIKLENIGYYSFSTNGM